MATYQRINTPDQTAAIRRLMTNMRRHLRTPCKRAYPKFEPGVTTTAQYITAYRQMNISANLGEAHEITSRLHQPAPYITGPEVTAEAIAEEPLRPTPPAPIIVPLSTREKTMTIGTPLSAKVARINAYLLFRRLPALTEDEALELLKANAMSPRRVIREMKKNDPSGRCQRDMMVAELPTTSDINKAGY